MSTCQYFGQTNCSAPVFGGGRTPVVLVQHENFFERYFMLGTSPLQWAVNGFLWLLVVRLILWPLVITPILDWIDFHNRRNISATIFELTPYHTTSQSFESMTEFFKIVHAQLALENDVDHTLRRKRQIALEIVSDVNGIRFIARIPDELVDSFKQALTSLQHEVKVNEIGDYIGELSKPPVCTIQSFRQRGLFLYPIRKHSDLSSHDPITYITRALSSPNPKELFALQLVLSPHTNARQIARIRSKLAMGRQPFIGSISLFKLLTYSYELTIKLIVALYNTAAFILNLLSGSLLSPTNNRNVAHGPQMTEDNVIEKLSEPLFFTDIRLLISTDVEKTKIQRINSVASAYATFDDQGRQSLRPNGKVPIFLQDFVSLVIPASVNMKIHLFKYWEFVKRQSSMFRFNANLLSISEIATLYHFPYEKGTTTEGIARSMSRMLPPPKRSREGGTAKVKFDIILGENDYHDKRSLIGLTSEERRRHLYIVGGTGNGKTTMLEYAIEQDIRAGKGVAIVDPHGDLAQNILTYVSEERVKDVIYFNPSDLAFPIGINLLELPEGLSEEEALNEKDFVTESVVSIFRKIFSEDDSGGHRIEYILRNAIHTAMTIDGATLFTILKLLRSASYRKTIVSKLDDQDLKEFWLEELGKAGDFQRVKMSAGITSKIDRFRRSESIQRIMGQKKSTINFDEILDGKILICNLAKGLIGEDTSELLGVAVLTKIQLAAYRRIRKTQNKRRPFFVYVDEFQNFATTQFLQMLSEARKYGLVLTMAEQSTAQQYEQRMVEVILNNVGTLITFRTGSSNDERLLLPHFKPYLKEGEIGNLPAYNFYARIRATETFVPTSGKTILLRHKKNARLIKKIMNQSKKNYALEIKRKVDEPSPAFKNDQLSIIKKEVPELGFTKKSIELGRTT